MGCLPGTEVVSSDISGISGVENVDYKSHFLFQMTLDDGGRRPRASAAGRRLRAACLPLSDDLILWPYGAKLRLAAKIRYRPIYYIPSKLRSSSSVQSMPGVTSNGVIL